jgi:hypothetical protein
MAEKQPQRTSYPLRIPEELRTELEKAANLAGRSLHAEIVLRLQASIQPKQDDRLVKSLTEQIRAYQALLRRAAGSIHMALIRGRERKIPEEDARWLADEYKELMKLANTENDA